MSKPGDTSQEAWDEAYRRAEEFTFELGDFLETVEIIARAIMAAEQRGEEREREACAQLAEGDSYHEHYRTWPWWKMADGCGNRSNESELVKHADAIADAIRARGTP